MKDAFFSRGSLGESDRGSTMADFLTLQVCTLQAFFTLSCCSYENHEELVEVIIGGVL